MVWILLHKGVDALLKWVDDFIFFRYPRSKNKDNTYNYSYDESLIWNIAKVLGWPWAPSKFIPFAFLFLYIGFLWSLTNKTVELPAAKKEKYIGRLAPWTTPRAKMSLEQTETIIGTLNHVSLVVPAGRAHLSSFYAFRATFQGPLARVIPHTVSSTLRTDALWWTDVLSQEFVGLKIMRPPPVTELDLFGDASTSWGLGLIINNRWLAWELKDGWQGNNNERHIGWAEMVIVELIIRTLIASGLSNARVLIRSDNKGVVGALRKGFSRGSEQNRILRHIIDLMQVHSIWVDCEYIPTDLNPADGPSRGVFPPRTLLHPHPPAIPKHLTPYVHDSVKFNDSRLS